MDADKITDGADLPAKPVLQQAEGDTAVYLVDGTFKHHVTSGAVLEAWRMSKADVQKKTKAEIAALETAAVLRPRPVLVTDSAGRILLLDDPLPGSGAGGTGGAAAGGAAGGGAPASGGSPGSAGAGGEDEAGGEAGAGGDDNDAGAGGETGDGGKASAGKAGSGGATVGSAGKAGQGGKPRADDDAPVNVAAEPGDDGACSVGRSGSGGGQGGLLFLALAGLWRRRRTG